MTPPACAAQARAQVRALFAELSMPRAPFLRRSLREDALLTTDLPLAAEAAQTERFCVRLRAMGWEVLREGGLLELTPLLAPPPLLPPAPPKNRLPALERLCSLLARHPDGGASRETLLAFLKAADAGTASLERFSEAECRRCAALLRQRLPLPGTLLPYAHAALREFGAG